MECGDQDSDQSYNQTKLDSPADVDSISIAPTADIRMVGELSKTSENGNSSQPIEALQSKKELKRERKLQKRLQMRAEYKLRRKLKDKERRKTRSQGLSSAKMEKPKLTSMADSNNKIRVVIDFSYDELMNAKDLVKCGNQVVRCYSANRRSSNPLQLHFCNFSGDIRVEMKKCYEFSNWDIHFHEDAYLNVFPKEDLIYLTSESKNVLETLEENKVYIIGGLVDHNAHKGVSYRKAVLEGIAHAQLPIRKYIQMKSRSVLTINHVFEILLKVSNGEPWSKALCNAVPQRFFNSPVPNTKNEDVAQGTSSSNENLDETNTCDQQVALHEAHSSVTNKNFRQENNTVETEIDST